MSWYPILILPTVAVLVAVAWLVAKLAVRWVNTLWDSEAKSSGG